MKLCYFLFCTLFASSIFSQEYIDKSGNSHLWGKISVEQLKETPYRDWFEKQSMDYTSDLLPSDIKHLKDVTVKIYLGTWCGDTKYLLPRFIKTWEQLGLSEDQLELVALHHEGDLYKQAPDNETNGYNIHRVPTFIFERNGVEINRIVERTQFDLDTDIQSIAQGLPYKPRYKAVTIVNEIIENNPVDSLTSKSILNSTFNKIRREVSTSGELNTYGYVLLTSGEQEKAEFVFLINSYLFPYDPMVRDSYGEVLLKNNKLEDARDEYYEALRIKGEDTHIIKQLATIDDLMQQE